MSYRHQGALGRRVALGFPFDSDDQLHQAAKAILADPDVTLATLDLARYEVANVAVWAWRDPGQVSSLLEAIDRIADDGGITPGTTTLLARAAELAEQQTISVCDAAYVAAASQAGATLVSCDTRDLVSKGLASSCGAGSGPSGEALARAATWSGSAHVCVTITPKLARRRCFRLSTGLQCARGARVRLARAQGDTSCSQPAPPR